MNGVLKKFKIGQETNTLAKKFEALKFQASFILVLPIPSPIAKRNSAG
jgi:hypothetical protein